MLSSAKMKNERQATMSDIKEHVAQLSQNIGPRPAGTEEERQAALYVADAVKQEAGLDAEVEDFDFSSHADLARLIYCAVTFVVAVLSLFISLMALPAFIISLVSGVLFAAETLGIPLVSRFMGKGMSQNVVSRYMPATAPVNPRGRRRKVVIVANYDSGRVRRDLPTALLGIIPILKWAELGAMVLVPILELIRFATQAPGAVGVVLNVLTVIAIIVIALPIVSTILNRTAPYSEGANCNASGTAVMIELAKRVKLGAGAAPSAAGEDEPTIHGEAAARAAGLIPDGAELVYDAPETTFGMEGSTAESLLAAKAAIARLSGKPVSETVNIELPDDIPYVAAPSADGQEHAVDQAAPAEGLASEGYGAYSEGQQALQGYAAADAAVREAAESSTRSADGAGASVDGAGVMESTAGQMQVASSASVDAAAAGPAAAAPAAPMLVYAAPAQQVHHTSSVPDWYKAGQEKAHKKNPAAPAKPAQRSRYADALDAAVRESSEHFQMANEAVSSEAEMRLQQMRDSIMEVKAPNFEDIENAAQAAASQPAPSVMTQSAAAERAGNAPATDSAKVGASASAAESAAPDSTGESTPHSKPGIDGYLSRTMESAAAYDGVSDDDASAQTSGETAASDQVDPSSTIPFEPILRDADDRATYGAPSVREVLTPTRPAAPQGDRVVLDEDGLPSIDLQTQPAASAGQPAVSDEALAAADRTISFIPVAVDEQELRAEVAAAEQKPAITVPAIGNAAEAAETAHAAGQAAAAAASAGTASQNHPHRRKRDIALPRLTGSFEPLEEHKQRAPLADGSSKSDDRAKKLRAMVPAVGNSPRMVDHQAEQQERQAALRQSLPSLSGTIRAQAEAEDEPEATSAVSQAGSFGSISATGAFAPVGDELLEDVDPDEMYVDDVDDSAYGDQMTETGAFAGPGYVEMPKSRASRFFGKFHLGRKGKKKEQEESTPQEWIGVDDDFEAREVGKARGGWESFRDDAPDAAPHDRADAYGDDFYDDGFDDFGYDDDSDPGKTRRWNGGAFSSKALEGVAGIRDRARSLRGGRTLEEADEPRRGGSASTPREKYEEAAAEARAQQHAQEPDPMADAYAAAADFAAASASLHHERYDDGFAADMSDEVQQIHQFRAVHMDTEVWFVALGAELAGNAGMKAFIAAHAAELKGAIVVNLDGLGAGDLTLIEREGTYRAVKMSSRMKRLTRKASSALNRAIGAGTMLWGDSTAACAMRHGLSTMHLAGMDGAKPAFFGELDDVVENIDDDLLEANADYVTEVLRNI